MPKPGDLIKGCLPRVVLAVQEFDTEYVIHLDKDNNKVYFRKLDNDNGKYLCTLFYVGDPLDINGDGLEW